MIKKKFNLYLFKQKYFLIFYSFCDFYVFDRFRKLQVVCNMTISGTVLSNFQIFKSYFFKWEVKIQTKKFLSKL